MSYISKFSFLLAVWLMASSLSAVDKAIEDPDTRVEFPGKVSIQQDGKSVPLTPTGVATRTKFIIKIYSMAHYMDQPPKGDANKIFQEILTDNRAKEMQIQWTYAVDLARFSDGFRESFHKVLNDEQYKTLQPSIDQFIGFFKHNINLKDKHVINWLPGGTIEVEVNGEKQGTIANNKDFAVALWSIWFGPHSVVNRNRLIEFIVQK